MKGYYGYSTRLSRPTLHAMLEFRNILDRVVNLLTTLCVEERCASQLEVLLQHTVWTDAAYQKDRSVLLSVRTPYSLDDQETGAKRVFLFC